MQQLDLLNVGCADGEPAAAACYLEHSIRVSLWCLLPPRRRQHSATAPAAAGVPCLPATLRCSCRQAGGAGHQWAPAAGHAQARSHHASCRWSSAAPAAQLSPLHCFLELTATPLSRLQAPGPLCSGVLLSELVPAAGLPPLSQPILQRRLLLRCDWPVVQLDVAVHVPGGGGNDL